MQIQINLADNITSKMQSHYIILFLASLLFSSFFIHLIHLLSWFQMVEGNKLQDFYKRFVESNDAMFFSPLLGVGNQYKEYIHYL